MIFQIIIFSISLSIDAFLIGISYNLKGIKIQNSSKIIIGIISTIIMYISLFIGNCINILLTNKVGNIIGILILIVIGIIFIRNSILESNEIMCDLDNSKKIDNIEAIILGITLSADSIGAGIAAASIGLNSIIIPVTVGIMQIFFLSLGNFLISKFGFFYKINKRTCGIFSGILLIIIALLRSI